MLYLLLFLIFGCPLDILGVFGVTFGDDVCVDNDENDAMFVLFLPAILHPTTVSRPIDRRFKLGICQLP